MKRQSRESRYQQLRRLSDGPYPALTIRYGRRYLRDYPDHGSAWMALGIALFELARYEEAEQALGKAIEFCPEDKLQCPFSQMGHLFRQQGDFEQAEKWYRKAIFADPADASYYIYLGAMFAKQGRFYEAEENYRTAIQCSEGCIDEAYLNLGLVLRARERFREAAECFREAIRLDPKYRAAKRALRDVELCIKLGSRH